MNVIGFLTSPAFLSGALVTVALTVLSMLLGILGGLVLAGIGAARFAPVRGVARAYIWLFRGTPVLLQLIFVFNVLPLVGLRFDSFTCAIIALSLNEAAYMAEIIRGGLLGVPAGQRPAAQMLGFTRSQTLVFIVLPQVARLVLPPTGNQLIGMLKTSALASVVAVQDLMLVAQRAAAGTFDYVGTLIAAAVLYLLLTTVFSGVLGFIERRMDTGRKSARRRKRAALVLAAEGGH